MAADTQGEVLNMMFILKNLKHTGKMVCFIALNIYFPTALHATPTLVDSVNETQLQGIEVKNISSMIAGHGTLWITDESNQVFQWQLGSPPVSVINGNKTQKFSSIMPISKNRAVVTDAHNHRFLIGTDGHWQAFAEKGEQEGKLDQPIAAAWSKNGLIYIAEAGNDRVSVFTDDGLFLFSFGNNAEESAKDQNLTHIKSIALDQQGRVYVLDAFNGGRISIYSALGKLDVSLDKDVFELITHEKLNLIAMTVRPDGVLIVADKKTGRIFEMDWENTKIISSFATIGKGRGQLQRVSSLSLDDDGKLYVADNGNKKVEVFQLDWEQNPWLNQAEDKLTVRASSVLISACDVSYIYAAESMLCINSKQDSVTLRSHDGVILQTLEAKFNNPIRAAFDQNEILILDDKGVKVFDQKGMFKFAFGSTGKRDGELSHALGLAITPTAVYIADTGNHRVQVFSRNGLFQRAIGNFKNDTATLEDPSAIAADKRGLIYVADSELNKVFVYAANGELKHQIGASEKHPLAFIKIYDLMVDQENVLYIMASTLNNPLSVWMYQDADFIYRYSPTAQAAKAGFDQQWVAPFINTSQDVKTLIASADASLLSTTALTIDPTNELFAAKGGFFSDTTWLFNRIPYNRSAIALVDLTHHARHTFQILRAPKQVRHVVIDGDEKNMTLEWASKGQRFSGYYRVYGRKGISSPFEMITQTIQPQLKHTRQQPDFTEYRISAVSPHGKESKLSSVYQDEFWLGYRQYQAKHFTQALPLLLQATANNPNHASAWLYLGQNQLKLGMLDNAITSFKQLAKFPALKQQALHLQAQTLMEKQAWLDVKVLVDDAEQNNTVDAILYSLAAKALIQMDDIPSAIYYLDQAVALEPSSPIWHLALAHTNFELGANDHAKAELAIASQLARQDVLAWLDIARSYKKHQLFDESISSYNSALLIAPTNEQALSELAVLQLEQNHLDKARSLATQMTGTPALKATSYYILGRVALAEGKAPQALAMLAKAGQTNPSSHIWLAMADAYAALNNSKQENDYLKKAIALDDQNFDIHMRLAQSCALHHDTLCMLTHFERATQLDQKNIDAQLGFANALIQAGKMLESDNHAQRALKLDPTSIPAHLILARSQSARGMIPDSIATLKKAIALDHSSLPAHLDLAHAYIANHMYDEAMAITEKASLLDVLAAAPLALTGEIYLARQSFDEAIAAFEKAITLAPEHAKYKQQLNMAYLQKKRTVDAGGNTVGPKLKHLQFSRVFSAAYKQYTDVPVGKLTLGNEAGIDYTNVKISLFIKEYMDFPTTTTIENIAATSEIEIPLLAAFNNRILDIDEDTGVQTEVRAEYYLAGKPHVETRNESLTIYGKNAIAWDQLDMVGSFATPKDDALAVFTRQLINAYNPQKGAVNTQIAKAMTVFNGLSAYGIKYLVDPNTPYGKLDATQLDTIQFPRETLRQRSGDCDDLSILLVAALANLGIETAILDVPEHLLMMFNTGVPASQKDSISSNDEALAIIDDEVWVPVEATLIAASFTEAWAEGARKYHLYGQQAKMKIMPLATAWKKYPPVTLPPADFTLTIPSEDVLGNKIKKEWEVLSVKALERQVRPYRIMLALDPENEQAQMQIAIVYAQNGLFSRASTELEHILANNASNLAALNNIGNIHYLQQDYHKALSMYERALEVAPNNADIMVNISMVHYKLGDAINAKALFAQATEADEQVPARYKALALLLKQ